MANALPGTALSWMGVTRALNVLSPPQSVRKGGFFLFKCDICVMTHLCGDITLWPTTVREKLKVYVISVLSCERAPTNPLRMKQVSSGMVGKVDQGCPL